ncbi:MAG TPA: TorF family putative porin, partial [Pseudomonadales bacterium]
MNRLTSIVFGAALMSSALVASAAEIAGNVTLATDYRFRGISQNNGGFSPAIQGGFDWSSDVGLYIGTWASNVNFSEGAVETDVYGGFKGSFSDELAYDIGILYYGYPQ